MRIPGLKTLKQSARWLRSRFAGGALILGYHRIAETARDHYAMCVTPKHFAEQLQVVRQCAHPIRLQELVQGLQENNLPHRAVVLTIDDGYADALYNAKPLLERYQIPATVFVATGYMGQEFWWDELARLLLLPVTLPDRLDLSVNGDIYKWTAAHVKGRSDSRLCLLQSLYDRLLLLPSAARRKALAQLWAWSGTKSDDRLPNRALTPDELIELATGGLVDVGAHTVTHPVLAEMPVAVQRTEVEQSKSSLESLLEREVTSFSYPNGSISAETSTIVRDAGFSCACISNNDVVWRESDPFHLPRFWIPDWDEERFSRWFQRWLRP